MSEYEKVNHPPHYGGDTPYEAIKVIESWNLSYALGNAVKYISRVGKKPGTDPIEDLRKAAWYVQHEIERLTPNPPVITHAIAVASSNIMNERLVPRHADNTPKTDSNKHANGYDEYATAERMCYFDYGSPKQRLRPYVTSALLDLASPDTRVKFKKSGKWAHSLTEKKLPQTCTQGDLTLLSEAYKEIYEPRPGVEGEMQMKQDFREGWGQ